MQVHTCIGHDWAWIVDSARVSEENAPLAPGGRPEDVKDTCAPSQLAIILRTCMK